MTTNTPKKLFVAFLLVIAVSLGLSAGASAAEQPAPGFAPTAKATVKAPAPVAIAGDLAVADDTQEGGGADIDCQVPNGVSCAISHSSGIARVYVDLVDYEPHLYDRTYRNCPTEVDISFDAINPNFEIKVVPCEGRVDEFQFERPPVERRGGADKLAIEPHTLEDEYCSDKPGDQWPPCDDDFVSDCDDAHGTMSDTQPWGGKTCFHPS